MTANSHQPEDQPATTPERDVVRGVPPTVDVPAAVIAAGVATGRRMIVLDDDPTGSQSIRDLPVLTAWAPEDVAWGFAQPTPAFFILTNSRSLDRREAERINREIATTVEQVAVDAGVDYVFASRSDSTLRGHYPLETDVLAEELVSHGRPVDGVVLAPALIEPGRITIDSVHWMRTLTGMLRVGDSEFARDRTFGYTSSDLRDWISEKTDGRVSRDAVARITLTDLRTGGPGAVADILRTLDRAAPVVVDALDDADLRVLTQALLTVEAEGRRFLYRCGPSFVRARTGQRAQPPAPAADLRSTPSAAGDHRPVSDHGLIVVGSHVALTTRQLAALSEAGVTTEVELQVELLLDPDSRDSHLAQQVARVIELLTDPVGDEVVLRTSRTVVAGRDGDHSLEIARSVSAALVGSVRAALAAVRPAYVLAKGGITSADTATAGLGIRRAWSRGTVLPGTVSVWEPVAGPAAGVPYAVFAGNVGDDNALLDAVTRLRDAQRPPVGEQGRNAF